MSFARDESPPSTRHSRPHPHHKTHRPQPRPPLDATVERPRPGNPKISTRGRHTTQQHRSPSHGPLNSQAAARRPTCPQASNTPPRTRTRSRTPAHAHTPTTPEPLARNARPSTRYALLANAARLPAPTPPPNHPHAHHTPHTPNGIPTNPNRLLPPPPTRSPLLHPPLAPGSPPTQVRRRRSGSRSSTRSTHTRGRAGQDTLHAGRRRAASSFALRVGYRLGLEVRIAAADARPRSRPRGGDQTTNILGTAHIPSLYGFPSSSTGGGYKTELQGPLLGGATP